MHKLYIFMNNSRIGCEKVIYDEKKIVGFDVFLHYVHYAFVNLRRRRRKFAV